MTSFEELENNPLENQENPSDDIFSHKLKKNVCDPYLTLNLVM